VTAIPGPSAILDRGRAGNYVNLLACGELHPGVIAAAFGAGSCLLFSDTYTCCLQRDELVVTTRQSIRGTEVYLTGPERHELDDRSAAAIGRRTGSEEPSTAADTVAPCRQPEEWTPGPNPKRTSDTAAYRFQDVAAHRAGRAGELFVRRRAGESRTACTKLRTLLPVSSDFTLKRFLIENGVGQDVRFWKLAQALAGLYPPRHRRTPLGRRRSGPQEGAGTRSPMAESVSDLGRSRRYNEKIARFSWHRRGPNGRASPRVNIERVEVAGYKSIAKMGLDLRPIQCPHRRQWGRQVQLRFVSFNCWRHPWTAGWMVTSTCMAGPRRSCMEGPSTRRRFSAACACEPRPVLALCIRASFSAPPDTLTYGVLHAPDLGGRRRRNELPSTICVQSSKRYGPTPPSAIRVLRYQGRDRRLSLS